MDDLNKTGEEKDVDCLKHHKICQIAPDDQYTNMR
jgi:hypothetical protein